VTAFEPDDTVPDVVRMEAQRSGQSQDQVDAAVRQDPGPSVLDRLSERNRLDEAEAGTIALEEITAHREPRRNLRLPGDELSARVRAAPRSTADDVSITRDGRRLDSRSAVVEWLAEVDADRAADRYVEFDEP
jgi:hypothetical protein